MAYDKQQTHQPCGGQVTLGAVPAPVSVSPSPGAVPAPSLRCDICDADLPDAGAATLLPAVRVLTSPGFWECLARSMEHPCDEGTYAQLVSRLVSDVSGFTTCCDCRTRLTGDAERLTEYGLGCLPADTDAVDVSLAREVAAKGWEKVHGHRPQGMGNNRGCPSPQPSPVPVVPTIPPVLDSAVAGTIADKVIAILVENPFTDIGGTTLSVDRLLRDLPEDGDVECYSMLVAGDLDDAFPDQEFLLDDQVEEIVRSGTVRELINYVSSKVGEA